MLSAIARADVLGEYSFEGVLGEKIPFKIKFCVNHDEIAVGEIYYPKASHPAPILIVGTLREDGSYRMNEYQADGTVTGCMIIKIAGEDTADGPYIERGSWMNPQTFKEFKMNKTRFNNESVDVGRYLDYEDPQNIGREYAYHIWNPLFKRMGGGKVKFRGAGVHKIHFEVENSPRNTAEGASDPDRPAQLGDNTYDYFDYYNVNDCGYGFHASFFKRFVVLKTLTPSESTRCFGMGASFDGVYIKVKQ